MAAKKAKKATPPKRAPKESAVPIPAGIELVRTIELDDTGLQLACARRSDLLAIRTAGSLGLLRTSDWSVTAHRRLTSSSIGSYSLTFSPDAAFIACSQESEFKVLRTADLTDLWQTSIKAELGRAAWSPNRRWIAAGTGGRASIPVFDASSGTVIRTLNHQAAVLSVVWSPDGSMLATAGYDGVLRIWRVDTWKEQHRLELFKENIFGLAWSNDGKYLALGSADYTTRVLRMQDLQIEAVLEGHTGDVYQLDFSRDGLLLLSCSDGEQRLWSTRTWSLLGDLPAPRQAGYHNASVFDSTDDQIISFSEDSRSVLVWRYDVRRLLAASDPTGGRYVNAKVVLVGDTGVGKSGLGLVLSKQAWTETGSTHGRNVWMFDSDVVKTADGQIDTRETLLWDLAGQPDYRLVHQLHLTDVATALVVFDSRSQTDPLAGVKYWNRALRQATQAQGKAAIPMKKFLVAARSDVGRIGFSAERVNKIVDEFGFDRYFETSAKERWGIDELRSAIAESIDWSALPIVSSNRVFEEIKQFLLAEKGEGRLLSTSEDLYRSFASGRKSGDLRAEFDTCIGRLESRGLIQRLSFGDLVLLQPEIRDAYASALVSAAKDEPDGLGSIREDDARSGNFKIPTEQRLTDASLERLLLISTVEDLLKHEIALREHGDDGVYLVFPSQLTRENPALPDAEGKSVVFTFDGPVTNIYATLIVRLSHSGIFKRNELWKNAATFTALHGGTYGVFLDEIGDGTGELTLFYAGAAKELMLQFEDYVQKHLRLRAIPETVRFRRVYACPNCSTTITDQAVRKRIAAGHNWIDCNVCEPPVRISFAEPAATPSAKLVEMDRAADAQRDKETAASVIEGKRQTNDFDVFLCHNGVDKPAVKEIAKKLLERGILPWLDEWEISPFVRWQDELAKMIPSIKSVAVFIGPSSERGPWQEMEIQAFLQEFAKRRIRIGLVLLPGAAPTDDLPVFLKPFNWVDFNKKEPEPFAQLLWGITGERPSAYAT